MKKKKKGKRNANIGNKAYAEENICFNSVYTQFFTKRNWSQLSPKTQKGLDLAKNYEEA